MSQRPANPTGKAVSPGRAAELRAEWTQWRVVLAQRAARRAQARRQAGREAQ